MTTFFISKKNDSFVTVLRKLMLYAVPAPKSFSLSKNLYPAKSLPFSITRCHTLDAKTVLLLGILYQNCEPRKTEIEGAR
mmetsp:Transcript_31149/g.51938  ORF Transcript_31149/g.51938 Transcript_31149/m.51938 type:complete len:80 (+) Transcript_31149:210-449(+)